MTEGSIFRWFEARADLLNYAQALRPLQEPIEADISLRKRIDGFCTWCRKPATFVVHSGVMFGDRPNLREGLICNACGLSNRARLMATAIREIAMVKEGRAVAILEQMSLLFKRLRESLPDLTGSEFVSSDAEPGSLYLVGATEVRHESIVGLSYPTASLDLLSHNDVLEHVFRFRDALRECRRVLRADGTLVFTCPFLAQLEGISILAEEGADGSIVHHSPPEYHGDPLRPEGALAFYHFGWSLVDECRAAGFREVACGVLYEPFFGFTSNNHPSVDYRMLPTILRAAA